MMSKSFTTILLVAALVALSATTVSAQSTTTTTTAATTTTTTATGTTSSASSTVTTAPAPNGNITSMPNFSSLATLISSIAADRSAHPGYSPTPGAGGKGSGASGIMLSEQSRGTVLVGLAMVFATTLMAVVGTVSL